MKFVLAFLLLIGISCQIGRGDCAPADTLIGELKEKMNNGMQYVKDTISAYMPNNMPSIPVPAAMEDGYESLKSGMGNIAEGTKEMAKDMVHNTADALD